MTRNDGVFQRALLGSLIVHALLFVAFALLPAGEPETPVSVYTVRIMEAPARPQARALDVPTSAISALKLEDPSLSVEEPPRPDLEAAGPTPPSVPQVTPPPTPEPAATPSAKVGPPALAQPETPSGVPVLPRAGETAPTIPQLPEPPQPPPSPPGTAPSDAAAVPVPPAPPPSLEGEAEAPLHPSAIEQLRQKVQSLNLQVDSKPTPAEPGASTSLTAPEAQDRSLLALGIFRNRVREAVKENYTFPGGFPANLKARIRVIIDRKGKPVQVKILESSGNPRFDNLVCLAAVNKAKYPPIPSEIEGEFLPLTITCAP